ncbi:MAG TPA: serine/threonine-protein kinase [Ktedonobacteraceae bacterium]|nr:serine/threonine-protein kinase [Ktedonobacteraceae bacterium]
MNGEVQAAREGRDEVGLYARTLGNYHLLRLLGRGRTGEVYLGEQVQRGTPAAVKLFWLHLMKEERHIFLDGMQAIAAYLHPHVPRIFEYGIVGDMPYLAVTYASRGTLSSLLPPGQPQTPERILPYVELIADALHCAHELALMHLDLQPGNLLLGEHYELLLSGMGLSLLVQGVHSSSKLDVVGNVLYLAPEQLRGQISPACDQYALGIIAYAWLCGQYPFQGTFIEVGKQHLYSPVPPLRAKVPSLSPEVEQVVLRALAKDPGERFESVKAFARAFERACQPQAFPPFSLSHGLADLSVTLEASTPGELPTVEDSREAFLPDAMANPVGLDTQPLLPSMLVAAPAEPQPTARRMNAISAPVTPPLPEMISSGLVPMPGVQNVNYAPGGTVSYAPPQARAGTWNGGNQTSRWSSSSSSLQKGASISLAARPASAYINTHLPPRPDMYVQRFSRRTVVLGLLGVAGLAAVGEGIAWYLMQPQAATIGSLLYTYTGHANQVLAVAWSPASRTTGAASVSAATPRIASGSLDQTVQVWDAFTGARALTYKGHTEGVEAVGWSPDGNYIASGGIDRKVEVWVAMTGQRLLTYFGHRDSVLTLAWSPDGNYIASAGKDATVQVWDARKGHRLLTYSGHKDWVGSVSWSPDGNYIASASADRTVQVWDARKGHHLLTYSGHKNKVWAVAWAGDSKRLASAGDDGTVQVWLALTGHPIYVYRGHSGPVETVAWSSGGKRVASGGEDKTVQLWDATSGANAFIYGGHLGAVWDVAWSPDGSKVASASLDHTVQVWQAV